jgi:hypothetical protein
MNLTKYDIELQKLSDIDKKLSIFYHKVEVLKLIILVNHIIQRIKRNTSYKARKLNKVVVIFNQTLEPKMKQFKDSKKTKCRLYI